MKLIYAGDPYINHFAQADTIIPGAGSSQAWDRYAYAMNNPLRYVDPSGHCAEPVTMTLCGIAVIDSLVLATLVVGFVVSVDIGMNGTERYEEGIESLANQMSPQQYTKRSGPPLFDVPSFNNSPNPNSNDPSDLAKIIVAIGAYLQNPNTPKWITMLYIIGVSPMVIAKVLEAHLTGGCVQEESNCSNSPLPEHKSPNTDSSTQQYWEPNPPPSYWTSAPVYGPPAPSLPAPLDLAPIYTQGTDYPYVNYQ